MASVFHHLLAALCVADLLFLISLVVVSPVALGVAGYPLLVYHIAECCCHLGLAASVFLTIAITLERYQAVCCSPHLYQSRLVSTGPRLLLAYYITPAVLLAVLLNIPRFLSVSPLGRRLATLPSYLRFLIVYQSVHPLTTTGLAPLLLLSILNLNMHISLGRFQQSQSQSARKEMHLTRMMSIIVLTFLLLNMPRCVIGLFEATRFRMILKCFSSIGHYVAPSWQLQLDLIARYMAVLNSSVNFLIYCVAGRQFRTGLRQMLHLNSPPSLNEVTRCTDTAPPPTKMIESHV